MPQVQQLREEFALAQLVLVGDRGMISHKAIGDLRELPGLDWITALKSMQIRALVQGETLQLGLFDEKNLFEFSHEDYPGERLVACRNAELGRLRAHKRQALLDATRKELEKIQASVASGRLTGRAKIGVRVGRESRHHRAQYLPHPRRETRGSHLPDRHGAQPHSTAGL
jgi:hypothetical protein